MRPGHLATFILFLFSFVLLSGQGERFLSYQSDIQVNRDRSILITDQIVYTPGDLRKRGIVLNYPTKRYLNDRLIGVSYDILEVTKDDRPEPYHTESSGDQLTVYFGKSDIFLNPGTYRYKITYKVKGQIGFYENYDEIYWNAVGNKSSFSIDKVSASVRLPSGAQLIQESAYVGAEGETSDDYTVSVNDDLIQYEVTRMLSPYEGFTVAVGFEKGIVQSPGILDKIGSLLIILLGLVFLLPYYIYTWWKYGQDPPTPPSYPIWESPEELSAASVNYIKNSWYQNKSFTASVIDLAIKGYLRIEEVEDKGFFGKKKHFDLVKLKESDDNLPLEEQQLHSSIFLYDDRISIKGKYDSTIENTYQNHKASLSAQHSDFIWKGHNLRFLWIPVLVTIAVGVLAIIIFMSNPYSEGYNMPFIVSFGVAAILGLFLYGYLIRKPTVERLDLKSKIKGFQMYLELTEKDRLNLLNPPKMTPQHFEDILPFAFALGVEHKWSEKFKTILEKAQYRPEWHNSRSPVYFSSHFGRDFSSTISKATTKPSKSGSGSGGGGFSGGGGGGGSVGSW